ncbi:hypothetical protein [Rhizobium ruizarguesonis]|uniref:hypothetical protein n=1 Tax=Rhizobium ruizarguesonis TaxID=2081791 RepID=UPI0013EE9932|nr:hypothetical protein [Rhizobium ruizarguesonis]
MADLVKELISGVVDSVLKEILKTAARKATSAKPKPPRKQVSKRRTAAGRSRQRRR